VLYASWERWPRGILLRIGAVRFLYRMVRAIVAAMLAVGTDRESAEALLAELAEPTRRARRIAPAKGLTLAAVSYPPPGAAASRGVDCPPATPVL
jgi:tRNA U38,U39,U40 pseudouridine synthase TruA